MTLADDLITALGSGWTVTATCPKPMFFNTNGHPFDPSLMKGVPIVGVSDAKADADPKSFNQARNVKTPFKCEGVAKTNADALYQINELTKLLNARTVTGGWMEITATDHREGERFDSYFIEGYEVMWRASTTFR